MQPKPQFSPGYFGLILSILGLIGVTFCSHPTLGGLGRVLALCSIPGLISGAIGRFSKEPRRGFWAVLLGAIGVLYLPTLWIHLFRD
jgi:hypothetical protein